MSISRRGPSDHDRAGKSDQSKSNVYYNKIEKANRPYLATGAVQKVNHYCNFLPEEVRKGGCVFYSQEATQTATRFSAGVWNGFTSEP